MLEVHPSEWSVRGNMFWKIHQVSATLCQTGTRGQGPIDCQPFFIHHVSHDDDVERRALPVFV